MKNVSRSDSATRRPQQPEDIEPQIEPQHNLIEKSVYDPVHRLFYIDGLRGFAAIMVVLFHMWIGAGSPSCPLRLAPTVTIDLLAPLSALGGTRVSLFFVLSGFLLYLPFAKSADEVRRRNDSFASGRSCNAPIEQMQITLRSWLFRRFRRLAPPYYAAIPLALLPVAGTFYLNEAWRVWTHHMSPRTPDFGRLFGAFPSCLIFMHGMVPGCEAPAFNGPLWTITPEVQLYFAFPLLIALSRWRGRLGSWHFGGLGTAVMVATVASVVYRVWLYREIGFALQLGTYGSLSSDYHCLANTFLGRLAEFALGMGSAELVTQERIPSPRVLIPAAALCLSWFLVLRSDLVVGGWIGHVFLASDPSPSPLADAMGGVTFSLLILCCAASDSLARTLSRQLLVKLGAIAYSLYLIHVPVLWSIHYLIKAIFKVDLLTMGVGSLGAFAINIGIVLPIALYGAQLFWAAFERPFLSKERQYSLAKPIRQLANY